MPSKKYTLYRKHKNDTVLWVDSVGVIGEHIFTFDKKTFYNLFSDYPEKLSAREWVMFGEENPYWVDFFRDRNIDFETKHWDDIEKAIKNHVS